MKISELAVLTGVSVRMLRYYEQEGLLSPLRSASGYRTFSAQDVKTVQGIVLLNKAGLPLAAIRNLLPCVSFDGSSAPLCDVLKSRVREQIAHIDSQVDTLMESRQWLADLLP